MGNESGGEVKTEVYLTQLRNSQPLRRTDVLYHREEQDFNWLRGATFLDACTPVNYMQMLGAEGHVLAQPIMRDFP